MGSVSRANTLVDTLMKRELKLLPALRPTHLRGGRFYEVADELQPCDVVKELKAAGAEILVNFIPTGSQKAARFYAECAVAAGCGFINCMPEFLSSDPEYIRRFETAHLPMVGDDIKSQISATILHRVLTQLLVDRGVKINKTSQLNFAGVILEPIINYCNNNIVGESEWQT